MTNRYQNQAKKAGSQERHPEGCLRVGSLGCHDRNSHVPNLKPDDKKKNRKWCLWIRGYFFLRDLLCHFSKVEKCGLAKEWKVFGFFFRKMAKKYILQVLDKGALKEF